MRILTVSNKVKTYALAFQTLVNSFLELGHELVWAADFSGFHGDLNEIPCKTIQIPIASNPFKPQNLKAFKRICQIIDEEGIEAVECSTPIGGLLGRLASKKKGIPLVIYSAHGFLFFDGAPLINRTLYKREEMWLAKYTDVLITINEEDYRNSLSLKLRDGGERYMIHGAGVEIGKRVSVDKMEKRLDIGVPPTSFMLVSGGFLNNNKNNKVIIQALRELDQPRVIYVVCGEGEKLQSLQRLSKRLHVEESVVFLGYRTDFDEILASADAFIMPSFREGVPRALLEAMDLGKPCIGSRTRGIAELIDDGQGGYLCNPREPKEFAIAIKKLLENPDQTNAMSQHNRSKVSAYSKEVVSEELKEIFQKVLPMP